VLERYGLARANPGIAACLASLHETDAPEDPRAGAVVVGTNRTALDAARRAASVLGFETILDGPLEGEARRAGRTLAEAALRIQERGSRLPACILRGGETTVSVRGRGRGGRSLEVTLAAALAIQDHPGIVVMGFSSDGIDGPTDSAGAVATADSSRRGSDAGLPADDALADNDSYRFFEALGELIRTGPTGTNVGDLAVALVYPAA
jgi:glycerate-2-kinase